MEMKEVAKYKTLWKMNSTSEPLFVTGVNGNPLKKFTIPKIRRTSGKVYLSRCYTNTREYSFIHDTLNECRLDVSRDLQSSWQFGDTKLIHNEGLEKNFTSKRSEMRESGRHGRELEEHFCFLALPQKDVTEIYHSGLSTKASSLRILGNPRLGIYIFRHVDVALNYAHNRSITVESIIIFKVLFGKVKKIQPSLDKSKVSLDPSPNFDCHMSRNTPSLKDTIELQAYSSAVYLYEYNILSKPVDKPRQCLPYAIVTVKFIGQKVDNGHFMTPLRPLATGFPRRTERTCSLNNCTVAKRIGKGKDATVIFEHFRKPIDPFVQEKCSCNASNSEINPSNSDISNSYGSMQNGNISVLETYSGHMEYNSAECRDTSQLPACDSGLSFIPSDTRESVNNGDLLNVTYLKAILSSLAAAFPLHNNTDSSTVITSKFIKDPRLMKRQERMGKHNTVTGLSEILPFEKSLDFVNSETNLSSMPANPASTSEGMPGDQTVVTNYLDASCFRISLDDPQTQAHNLGSKTYDCTAPNKITMAGQCENQDDFSFPMFLSSVAPEVEIQKHKEEKAQRSRQRDTIPFITDECSESHDSYESVNTCTDKYSGPISPESQFSNFKTVYETGHQMSTLFPLQSEESVHEYIQNTGKMRNFTDPEDNAKYEERQSLWKGSDHSFTNKRKIGPIDNYISLNQDDKEVESLDYLQKNCDQILITQGLEKPKSLPFTTEDKYELSHLALEIQNNLTPRVKKLPSKPPKNSLEYKDNIHTNFAISQKLLELKLEKPDQNCISIMADAFKEAGDIPQTTQLPAVTSCHDIKTAHNANCSITREHPCVQRRNEYDPVSLKDIQRDCKETTLINNKGQHHTQFCIAQLNNGVHLNTDFREQRDNDKENQKEAEMENIASSIGNNIGDIYGDEEQSFQTHKTKIFINIGERQVNKDDNSIEILSSEKFSPAFNLTSGIKHVCTESASLESEDPITIMKEKDIQNTERTGEHLISTAFLQVASSSLHVASRAAVEITDAAMPVVSTNPEDHQRSQFKETCSSESPDFGLLSKPKVSACEIDTDKNRCHNSFHQSVSDNSVLQSFKLDNETEVRSEESDDAFPVSIPQDTHSPENVLYEEFEDSYEALRSRIDWNGLLGSSNGEVEVLESSTRGEDWDQHSSEEHNCVFSSTEKYEAELVKPILLPDLQVTITNTFMKGFSSTVESLASKDDFCKYVTEATKSEINEEEEEVLEFEIHSQCSGENSDHPSEGEFGNIRQDSGLTSKSETSLSFDLSHNMHVNHMSEKQNRSLLTEPSDVTTVNNKNRCSLTKSKTSGNDTRSKKETEARISKRKPGTPFRDQNIPDKNLRHHKICEKRRKLTSQDSLECFFSLSQERIKTFSQSEKHIRSVLDILNSEASLCKSKRLSRKLDRAVLHLKKAHRRVHTSLQLITKVGEKRRGPLPRAYAVICNSFWESCDLQGYSSLSERKYYSTKHFLSKRKYNKPGENRALGFEVDRSLTHVSKHKFYRTSRERLTECLSENVSSVSRSHTTVHMREYCDQVCPESQLALCSVSESTSQSAFTNSLRNPKSSEEFQPFSRKTGCLFSPDCPDEKLTKKENRTDTEFSSNISKYEKLENHSALDNIKYTTKVNNSEAKEITSKRNLISLSCIKENNISFGVDQNYYATCIAHTKVKTDIVISVLESKVWHFFNIDIHKPNNLILSGYKINLEVNFPVEKWTTPKEISKPGIITGNFLMDPLSRTLITSKKSNSIPQLLSIAATDSEGEFSKSSMAEWSITAVEFSAVSTIAPHCVQGCGGNELQKTDSCSSSKWIHINGNETDVENSEVTVTSETEESKDNTMKVFSDDSFLLVKDNIKGSSSQEGIAEKDIQDREMWKDKQAEKGKDSIHMNMTEASSVKTEDKGQKNKILEGSSCLSEKTMKNNLIDPHVKIKKATEAISLRNIASNQLNKRKKEEGKGSHDSQCDSSLHSEIACDSKPGITGRNHMPHLRAHSEPSKVSPPPKKKSTSYMNEFKEKHCSSNNLAPIVKLTQILRRANETSSVQILQEETEVCLNILPLFVEAFERKQKCSFKQILILRDLLVEENLWSNCRHRLKPCAVDSLVELQMMVETIQFIENKKRLLRGEQTFRSLLWYDETLYSELLGRPRGFQQQSNFYPAFQGRLKYNAFSELQNYHDQLIELAEESKRENNSYYTYLKYKRQIDECEAVMKQCSDCFDFSLSVPFTCGVNFGDSLGDLETLRKSILSLISMYGDCPQNDSCPGKQDHLWIIMEMISSKVNFIKSNEAVNIKIALYGLEHIFFDASKSLVWKEKRQSFCKKYSEQNKEMLLRMNQCAVSKLQKIYDTLSKDLSSEQISTIGLEEDSVIASRKSNAVVNKAIISVENSRLNGTLLSHPDICCVSEILDQAEFADVKKLQELTLRCTDDLEILKKCFQFLQEDSIDSIFITEENSLNMMKNYSHKAVILKPAAVETYIEIVMLSETIQFLKNSVAKKLDRQRFRSLLWFDLSLLPELVHCQEKMTSFSFLKGNPTDCLGKVIETAISELKKDLDIIYKYNEAVNGSYALRLLSRELEELSEIKKLIEESKYSVSTYINFVPCIASINYGSTVTELEYNYSQFSTLLGSITATPRKDLGKMVHIVKIMKTIEHMKIICVKNAQLTVSFILCQMLHNRKKTLQPKRKKNANIHVKRRKRIKKSSTCRKVPLVSEYIIKNVSNSSKKRPITVDTCGDSEEQEKSTAVSSCKKQKVSMKHVTEIKSEKSTFKHARTMISHSESENEIEPDSSDSLKRSHISPKQVETQRSLPLMNLKDSEDETDLTDTSFATSEGFTRQQGNISSTKKRNINFSAAETKSEKKNCSLAIFDQKSVDGTFSKDQEMPPQKFLKNLSDTTEKSCPSDIKPGTDASLLLNASEPIFRFVSDSHANLEMNDTDFELQDNEILNSSINSTCTSSPEPMHIQNKIPVVQINKARPAKTESKEKYMKDTLNFNTIPVEASENITLSVNQTVEYSLSEQQNSKVLTQNAATYLNEIPQSMCTPEYDFVSGYSFETSYPYYSWCVYRYSSSNDSSITQTYQGITSYEVQPPPSGILTAATSNSQNTHSHLLCSQYFEYFAGEPQANDFVPVSDYFPPQMPIYNFQQPVFSQYTPHQLFTAYPCSPDSGALLEVPWTYDPCHQEPFQPGH